MIAQQMPGGVVQRAEFDRAGEEVGLAYDLPASGSEDSHPVLGWTLSRDVLGRIASVTGPAPDGSERVSSYVYDGAARLTGVTDAIGGTCATSILVSVVLLDIAALGRMIIAVYGGVLA